MPFAVENKAPLYEAETQKQKTTKTPVRLKVLHLAGTSRGAKWMSEQLRELAGLGHSVQAFITAEGSLAEKLSQDGVRYHLNSLDVCWTLSEVAAFLKTVYKLAWHFYSERYEVVHSHLFPSMILGRLASWLADVPLRYSMIPGTFYMEAAFPPLLERATAWMDTRIIASCKLTKQLYLENGTPETNLALVYYGPDQEDFNPDRLDRSLIRQELLSELGLSPSAKLIGVVAYFYPTLQVSDFVPPYLWGRAVKNHEIVVEAMQSVVKNCPEAVFLFIGDGWGEEGQNYLNEIKALVKTKECFEHARFMGNRDDVVSILAALDVSLQCSLNENLGGTIESLLMRCPLIATRVGGMVDSVLHETTGLLVEPDDAHGLSDAIVRLLNDRKLAMRLGNNGRALMLEQFSLKRTVSDLDCLYQEDASRVKQNRGLKGYRWYVSAYRSVAVTWWILFACWIFCRREIIARAGGIQAQASADIRNRWYRAKHAVSIGPRFVKEERLDLLPIFQELLSATASRLQDHIVWAAKASRQCIYLGVKRILDIVFSSILLALFSPVFITILTLSALHERQAFDRIQVLGKLNKEFDVLCFANGNGNREMTDLGWSSLPMLLNVLSGDMSMVGCRLRCANSLNDSDPEALPERWYRKPGFTGWCQLNRGAEMSDAQLNGLDFLYMAHSSILLDCRILAKSLFTIVQKIVTFKVR